eukprot:TRINITY_DN6155_c0_g2_i1.p1 TRINITY_DN6155_c0_g2~~TRINITY_DN6155_c0_g2_i1.p1  ORF type:complete len:424 (+),score=133.68 TRINITY_DN6155_c0_g2_i1:84-1274(+)
MFRNIVFVGAKRTAFGSFGGSLKGLTATQLQSVAARAALAQAGGDAAQLVDHVIVGNVIQTSVDALYIARHVGLQAGCREDVPAVAVNRLCGSGFEAVVQGARLLQNGEARVILAGGTENMSQAPHCIYGARQGQGLALGKGKLVDSLWDGLTDTHAGMPMGVTAENLATQYKISQDEVDDYSVRSQQLFGEAQKAGRLADEICPTEVKHGKKTVQFETDEYARPSTKKEDYAKLPKVFKKDGVVHPGAASGICDGAAALVMTTEEFAKANGMTPLARLTAHGVAGCDPKIMGIGPCPASRQLFKAADIGLGDIDIVEVNEAFAPQVLAVQKELGIPMEKLNLDGGAIAVGHPLGASGARLTAHLIYALRQAGKKRGLGSACIGGGQGISVLIEAM